MLTRPSLCAQAPDAQGTGESVSKAHRDLSVQGHGSGKTVVHQDIGRSNR